MRNLFSILRITGLTGLLLLIFFGTSAQTAILRGTVRDPGGQPVQYANVLLLKWPDSSLVKGTVSDASGKYSFENIEKGKYCVTASFTGFEQVFTKVFEIVAGSNEIDNGILYLGNAGGQLKNVTITAKKPMFEQKADRMVINVKNSITNAGGTALDVLEKSPGVIVNRQDNAIAINGKGGVAVMINGKINYMPMDALVQLLAATPAGNIERIELITTPAAKYDAAGNAGYINIVFINNPYAGFNGSYFLTAGFGKRALGSGGINFNYRSAKINLYGNYAFSHDHYIQPMTNFSQYTRDGNIITNTSFSDRNAVQQVQNARLGVDYQPDTATTIGVLVSGYYSRWSMIAHNGASISKNNAVDSIITATDDPELNIWKNFLTNLNFQHAFKPGKTIFFDANYIYYKDNNPNTYATDYFNNAKEFLYHDDTRSGKITPIHFGVFSSDYTTPLGNKITMEAGAKIALSKFTNDVSVERLNQGVWIPDAGFTSNYLLKENIAAAYTSFTINPGSKILLKAGLRYEYTSSNLGTTGTANLINRKYGELFPTFYISRKFDAGNSLNFSYSRRITRPSFNDLAPFTVFFDPKTFYSGNPALQPAIANTLQASYDFKNYNFSFSYTHEANTIDNFYFQTRQIDTVNNILYMSARNFKSVQYLSASISLPFTVSKCWSMQNNINYNWRQINTTDGNAAVLLQHADYSFNSTQRFILPKDFSFELTGFYSSASYLGTSKRKPLYRLDAGLQKKFSNKKDILRLTANDIFNSGTYIRFAEALPGNGAAVNHSFNFGLFACRLAYTHNFGNKALKSKTERTTGAEDELKRVHN
jgi:Outer membrane protein beta-barrel family/Carboxypeptidase regulatory-like domain